MLSKILATKCKQMSYLVLMKIHVRDVSCKNTDADFNWLFKECAIPVFDL